MGAVTIYNEHGCYGPSARLFWNPEDPEGGQYYLSDLEKAGVPNNWSSAIRVPQGYTAILYDHDGFGAEKKRVRGSFISDRTQESPCINLHGGANDRLSSIKIIKDRPAVGYWQAITSTESQEY